MKLAEQSLTPLYQQVMDDISNGIEAGRTKPGEKIPSESELSELYGVSRITVRRAIEELAKEGLLTKRQGKGTYVNPPKLTRKIRQPGETVSFTEACKLAGRDCGAKVISMGPEEAPASTAAMLDLPVGAPILRIIRLRTVDGMPGATDNSVFPLERYEFLQHADLNDSSLFSLIKEHTQREPQQRRKRTIEVVRANPYISELLDCSAGEPLFREYSVFLDESGNLMYASRQHFLARLFIYDV